MIEFLTETIGHEYFIMLYGLVGWFLLDWSYCISKKKWATSKWWAESKDEVIVGLWFGPGMIIFDDEIISVIEYFYNADVFHTDEFHFMFYLGAGPFAESMYKLRHMAKKKIK